MSRNRPSFSSICLPALAALGHAGGVIAQSPPDAAGAQPEEVIITATLRPTSLQSLAGSATVLDSDTLAAAGEQHLADVLALVPDLSAAGGTSRPRYFQIRGVGEREQYQGAPNPSVGFLIDDIDLSGVGMPATLFDVERVEVLRGPQGTVYGANALGGLIHVRTTAPGEGPRLHAEALLGDYGTWSAGLAGGDAFADGNGGWRLVAQQYRSDGFRHNLYLARDSTNGYDERSLRLRLRRELAAGWQADLSAIDVRLANGYDAWSLDNTRNTLSDQPGEDAQHTRGLSLRLTRTTAGGAQLTSIASAADTRSDYSFDGDWANDGYWGANGPYDFYEAIGRRRQSLAEDLRYARGAWLLGAYALRLRESQSQLDQGLYGQGPLAFGPYQTTFDSSYQATNLALYGQGTAAVGSQTQIGLGLRVEQRSSDYSDSLGAGPQSARDRMMGGSLSWQWQRSTGQAWYAALARGYKAGGYNIGGAVPAAQRQFGPEALWNLEFGLHLATGGARPGRFSATLFAMRREHQQVAISSQADPANPLLFTFLTQNAGGRSVGGEFSGHWQLTPRLALGGSLALLDARYVDYCFQGVRQGGVCQGVELDGAREALAPPYQAALDLEYHLAGGRYLRLDWNASGDRYFGPDRAEHVGAYQVANLHLGVRRGPLDIELWVRNLFDAGYALHAFYFGNEPPDFAPKLYQQQSDPRHAGLRLSYVLPDGNAR